MDKKKREWEKWGWGGVITKFGRYEDILSENFSNNTKFSHKIDKNTSMPFSRISLFCICKQKLVFFFQKCVIF